MSDEVKQPKPLTVDSAWTALHHTGCVTPDGDPLCPLCRGQIATIDPNGGEGPRITCPAGCTGIEAHLQTVASMKTPKGEHVDRIAVLRTKLRLAELVKVVKHGAMGDKYVMHLMDGRDIDIGNVVALTTQSKFRAAFLPQAGRNPPRYKLGEWDDIAELIEQASQQIETSSDREETCGWVLAASSGQLQRNVDIEDSGQMFDLLGQREPPTFVTIDGVLHIRLAALQQWLTRQNGTRLPAAELGGRLSTVGLRPVQLAARGGSPSVVRKARYWRGSLEALT